MAKQRSGGKRTKKDGPRYPTRLLKELGQPLDLNDRKRKGRRANKRVPEDTGDVYEYEEGVPQEESGKNKRYDDVEKLEYELPSDFEDEEIDEDAAFGEEGTPEDVEGIEKLHSDGVGDSEEDRDEEEEEGDDDERYAKMMQDVTGKSLVSEDRRSEDSDSGGEAGDEEVDGGDKQLTVEDLLAPLQDKPGFKALKRKMQQLEKQAAPTAVPLPKVLKDKLDRKAGYEQTSAEVSKWQPIVRKNREARSLNFIKRTDISLNTTASLAADFEPTTELEKEVADVLKESGLANIEEIEAAEDLELNKLSIEEVKERQERLAKMRNLLFRHEQKAKRIKKIKSKTFHRLLRKTEKTQPDMMLEDTEREKEEALKQEFMRAQERMTLKHKNTSKWAKRILKRGVLHGKEDGTREAIAEQLRQHSLLTRKIHSAKDADSSEDDGVGDDETSASEVDDEEQNDPEKKRGKILAKAKLATLKALEGDSETAIPKTGVLALPFMARAIEMKRREAENEAAAVLEEIERAEEGENSTLLTETAASSGKMSFGGLATRKSNGKHRKEDHELVERGTDSELSEDEDVVPASRNEMVEGASMVRLKAVTQDSHFENMSISEMVEAAFNDRSTKSEGPVSIEAEVKTKQKKKKKKKNKRSDLAEAPSTSIISTNPGIFGSGEPEVKAVKNERVRENGREAVSIAGRAKETEQRDETVDEQANSQSEIEEEAVAEDDEDEDTIIRPRSQRDYIQEAFAGDDVAAEFEERKMAAMEEEGLKKREDDVDLPGWGQWTTIQLSKGPPKWLVEKRRKLKEQEEAARQRREDAKLKNVIISEKPDKKASKFLTSNLPFPYTSKEVFEKTLRMPIGRDFNTTQAFRELTKPAVIKRPGVIIDPIEYEEPVAKQPKKRKQRNGGSSVKHKKTRK